MDTINGAWVVWVHKGVNSTIVAGLFSHTEEGLKKRDEAMKKYLDQKYMVSTSFFDIDKVE